MVTVREWLKVLPKGDQVWAEKTAPELMDEMAVTLSMAISCIPLPTTKPHRWVRFKNMARAAERKGDTILYMTAAYAQVVEHSFRRFEW